MVEVGVGVDGDAGVGSVEGDDVREKVNMTALLSFWTR